MTKVIQYISNFAVAIALATLFSSCYFNSKGFNIGDGIVGSGTITKENRNANANFNKIEVKQGITLIVEQSNEKSIVVETDDNLQDIITTNIENGVLVIDSEEGYNATTGPNVTVKLPNIAELKASSGSMIKSNNTLISENLNVKSSSGSSVNITVEADALNLESSSGSTLKASGKALKLDSKSSSGSSIDAQNLLANEVDAQSSSGSTTNVAPILALKTKSSSGSSINYYKKPKDITVKESSGGSVVDKSK